MSVTVRFRFSRKGPVRYLGHLDMLRYFQKAVMRSGIPARYSEGFHPHQLMSFAYPLGVSMETEGDYMDLELTQEVPAEELLSALNGVMKEGISVNKVSLLKEGAANAMSLVAAADYRLYSTAETKQLTEAVEELLAEEELLIGGGEEKDAKPQKGKKGKKVKKAKDIRPGIEELRVEEDGVLFMRLQSGSAINVRPADVYALLQVRMEKEAELLCIRRLEIYGEEDGQRIPLSEAGAVDA